MPHDTSDRREALFGRHTDALVAVYAHVKDGQQRCFRGFLRRTDETLPSLSAEAQSPLSTVWMKCTVTPTSGIKKASGCQLSSPQQ